MRGRFAVALTALLVSSTTATAKPALEPDATSQAPAGGGGATAPAAAKGSAASTTPAPSAAAATVEDKDKDSAPVLRGADVTLTVSETSGVVTAPDAYENLLSFMLEPRYALGKRLLKHGWGKPISVGARIGLDSELAGSDPLFRGAGFSSGALFRDVPEQLIINDTAQPSSPGSRVDGAGRRLHLTDLWLTASQPKAARLGRVGELELGLRVVLPTSSESRISGLLAAPSLFAGITRKLGRFQLEYGLRAVGYLYSTTVSPISHLGGTVDVNGQPVTPATFHDDGKMNPSFGFVNLLSVSAELPRDFSVSADYSIINTFMHNPSGCTVPGVPTANVCADGRLLGDVRGGRHDSEVFNLETSYQATSWGTVALGLSTYQSIRKPNGDIANPFIRVTRDNLTTMYLSFSVSAEALASAAK